MIILITICNLFMIYIHRVKTHVFIGFTYPIHILSVETGMVRLFW